MFSVMQTERIILENNVSEKNDSAPLFPGQKHFSFLGLKEMFLVHAKWRESSRKVMFPTQ